MRKKKKLRKIREKIELTENQINQHKTTGNVETESYYELLGKRAAYKTMELIMLIECGQMKDVAKSIGKMMAEAL